MRWLLSLAILTVTTPPIASGSQPQVDWLTGREFQQRLEDPSLISLSGLPLRNVLQQVEQTYGLACFRDRRVDPDQVLEIPEVRGNVRHLLEVMAEPSGAGVSLAGNTVYLGPQSKARILRTVILLRSADAQRVYRNRADATWLKPRNFEWPLLSSPRDLVTTLAESLDVEIANPELIEHDVWAADALPEMSPVEIFSILLIGFDLTYVTSDDGKTVTLVSLPAEREIAIPKSYSLKEGETISDWLRVAPAIDLKENGKRVVVKGMVEDHEAIRDLRSGKLKPGGNDATELVPLDRRRFTLEAAGVPATAVIDNLEQSGIRIVYEQRILQQHGIDLEQHVKIDVNNATADEFFAALFGPLGLDCELSGITVRLKPQ